MSDIEEHIRRAMEEGKFENLSGQGKPLRLDDDPFIDPEWRMAYHVLQSSGFTLPWIERRRGIENDLEAARLALQQSLNWKQAALTRQNLSQDFIQGEWHRASEAFRNQITEINKRILAYNLEAPSGRFHLRLIDVERELELTAANPSDTLAGTSHA